MHLFQDVDELCVSLKNIAVLKTNEIIIQNGKKLREETIDQLVYNAVFNQQESVREAARWVIWETAIAVGIFPASIFDFYNARARVEFRSRTVPSINLRGLTYDAARATIRAAKETKTSAFIFGITENAIHYTEQRPDEYVSVLLAAAIKESHSGPIFIQGNHFQFNRQAYEQDAAKETNRLQELIREALHAGFFNIDVDSSTLVNLDRPTLHEQQRANFEAAAEMTAFIREIEPRQMPVCIGAELGELGGKNTTKEELRTFMDGYLHALKGMRPHSTPISKVIVQASNAQESVELPDGSIADASVDFETLEKLSEVAIHEYGMAGAVQRGLPDLPDEGLHHLPESQTIEVHLSTYFQNIIYDCEHFPAELRQEVYEYLKQTFGDEWRDGISEAHFLHKTRKKGFGPFKKRLWDLPNNTREKIAHELEKRLTFRFEKLCSTGTKELVNDFVKPFVLHRKRPF